MENDKTRLGDLPRLGKICIFSEFFFGLCVGAWSIALNFHLSACGVGESAIGVLLCVGYLVTAATSFFIGRVGDRRGYPFVMALGAAMMGAALLLIACVRQPLLFYLGHGLYCGGLACVMSMEYNLPLSLVREEQRQFCYNLVLVLYFLGSIAGNFLCGVCLSLFPGHENPYRYILMGCAVVYVLLALFRSRMPRQTSARSPASEEETDVWKLLRSRKVLSYLLYGTCTFGLLVLATGMLNLVLRLWHHLSDSAIGLVFSLNSIMGCLILALLPFLVRRVALYRISSVTMVIQFLALASMAFLPQGLFIGMILLRTATGNILYTSVDSPMLQSMPARVRGTYSGMRIFSNYVGMAIASMVSGWMIAQREFRLLFLTCAGMALAQVLIYQLLCRPYLVERSEGNAKVCGTGG